MPCPAAALYSNLTHYQEHIDADEALKRSYAQARDELCCQLTDSLDALRTAWVVAGTLAAALCAALAVRVVGCVERRTHAVA